MPPTKTSSNLLTSSCKIEVAFGISWEGPSQMRPSVKFLPLLSPICLSALEFLKFPKTCVWRNFSLEEGPREPGIRQRSPLASHSLDSFSTSQPLQHHAHTLQGSYQQAVSLEKYWHEVNEGHVEQVRQEVSAIPISSPMRDDPWGIQRRVRPQLINAIPLYTLSACCWLMIHRAWAEANGLQGTKLIESCICLKTLS